MYLRILERPVYNITNDAMCHYFTTQDCHGMLNMTDIKLELITDIDTFQFIEKGTHNGISYIANTWKSEQ